MRYRLHKNHFQQGAAGFGLRFWAARPAHGIPAEAVLDPGFWVAGVQGNDVTAGDEIQVLAQDGSYDLSLRVLEIGPNPERNRLWARVRVLRAWPESDVVYAGASTLPADRPALTTSADDLETEWGGPSHKWRVVRKSDKAVLAHGFASKDDAQAALKKAA